MDRKQMNIVVVGHVDHGKSTVIGRLLADTDSLPWGKLERVREYCAANSRPFEYAFLLDALKDEQKQGITIDSARCFFKTSKRDYIIIDAPGHIEFLKNMISGAARAEAAVLVIDAKEGVQENSRRHGYMLSMLGIKQVIICVNKMDLMDYDEDVFLRLKTEYSEFLNQIGITAKEFIPISASEGVNIAWPSDKLPWFSGNTVLSALDSFESIHEEKKSFRMPVQDVYKFTSMGDNRRIVAGRIVAGSIREGDEVVFLPSNKFSKIKSIEEFNFQGKNCANKGESIGVTLEEQIYVNRGEVMCKVHEKKPSLSSTIKSNIFWMGKNSLKVGNNYFVKLGTAKIQARVKQVLKVLDASSMNSHEKDSVEQHEVAECVLELKSPIVFDLVSEIKEMGRFVMVEGYDVACGGIITETSHDKYEETRDQVFTREKNWDRGDISLRERAERYSQNPKVILLTGPSGVDKKTTAKNLEKTLFNSGKKTYFLGVRNILRGLDSDIDKNTRSEHLRRFSELIHILLDAGLLVVATVSDLRKEEVQLIQEIISRENLITVEIGQISQDNELVDMFLESDDDSEDNVVKIIELLKSQGDIFSF